MAEAILIGTRGWDYADWTGGFYPPELPAEWRFCFYSNRLRSVLVPAEIWADVRRPAVGQWLSDSDPEFRFVFELPPALCRPQPAAELERGLDEFLRIVEPVAPRTAGLLLSPASPAPPDPVWLDRLLALLDAYRLCLDLPDEVSRPAVLELCVKHRAGRCWHCAASGQPPVGGRFRVARSPAAEPRVLRRILEQLHGGRGGSDLAALYFEGPGAVRAAEEARILAELMGV